MPQLLNEHNYSSYQGIGCKFADWSSMSVASSSVPHIGSHVRQINATFDATCCMYGTGFHIVEMLKRLDLFLLQWNWTAVFWWNWTNCCLNLFSQAAELLCPKSESSLTLRTEKFFFFEKNRKVMLRTLRRRRNSISIVLAKDNSWGCSLI